MIPVPFLARNLSYGKPYDLPPSPKKWARVGLHINYQATIRIGGLFRIELPLLVSDPDSWCKAAMSLEVLTTRLEVAGTVRMASARLW